ncbi:MAG: hypothetical protein ISN28_14535 [Ectothiorhodospiraceae bacterium AqS1]|nr:hypothetical protein [Ectothiorhodospiraceae bacterium AqS1]
MLDWEGLFRRYVWNDEKTPFFTAVPDLTRRQADYEIHLYCVFLGLLFSVITVIFAIGIDPESSLRGRSLGSAFYGFSVVCAAILLAFFKPPSIALYCTFAPVIVFAWVFFKGLGPNLARIDHIVIFSILSLLLLHSFRVVAIVRRYPQMPEPPPQKR